MDYWHNGQYLQQSLVSQKRDIEKYLNMAINSGNLEAASNLSKRLNSIEEELKFLNLPELPREFRDDRVRQYYELLQNTPDSGVNNYRKNSLDEIKSLNKYYSGAAPIDELATMGSDSGIVKDFSNYPIELSTKWNNERDKYLDKISASEKVLKDRGYEKYHTKQTLKNPESKIAFKNKSTGKVLKSIAMALPVVGMALAAKEANAKDDFQPIVNELDPTGLLATEDTGSPKGTLENSLESGKISRIDYEKYLKSKRR